MYPPLYRSLLKRGGAACGKIPDPIFRLPMNPILPIQYFVPDVEARQWTNGRMYLYGSYDLSGRTCYCSWEYRVFSSADLIHWEDQR